MPRKAQVSCSHCGQLFSKLVKHINECKKLNLRVFCSSSCRFLADKEVLNCTNCGKEIYRTSSTKSKNNFCSQSCAATYNNLHKSYGFRRSKLELFLESQLRNDFPDLEFYCNTKQLAGIELDFYFPSLNLAIEVNGPTHFKPIYGLQKFNRIQQLDQLKKQACLSASVNLLIVSNLELFTSVNALIIYLPIKDLVSSLRTVQE